jgi:DNA-directed RNA polymerase alpha subunit
MPHGQVSEEPFPDRDAALPERPDAAEHPLSGWAINALGKAGIRTVGELADRSADELLDTCRTSGRTA